MSATLRTTSTPPHECRPGHPSLLPPTRPSLVEAGGAPPVGTRRQLPGGAILVERRPHRTVAELLIVGEIDVYDRGAVIDACTAVTLESARHIRVDAAGAEFTDLRILEALAKVATFCHRIGGSFELAGLREPFASMWAGIAPDEAAPANARQDYLDDRVVPLHSPESAWTRGASTRQEPQEPTSMPARRIVSDIDTPRVEAGTRPA
jgi:anti-anti-sigma regulatory factor